MGTAHMVQAWNIRCLLPEDKLFLLVLAEFADYRGDLHLPAPTVVYERLDLPTVEEARRMIEPAIVRGILRRNDNDLPGLYRLDFEKAASLVSEAL